MAKRDFTTAARKYARRKETLRARCSALDVTPEDMTPEKFLAMKLEIEALKKANRELKEETVAKDKLIKRYEKEATSKDREIGWLKRKVEKQAGELQKKDEEIKSLKEGGTRKRGGSPSKPESDPAPESPQKNSNNSSIPPSRNPLGVKHTNSLRKPSGKKSGGQEGHPGSTRMQETDESKVTAAVRLLPSATCPVCGKALDMSNLAEGELRQVVDIRIMPPPIYRNYRSMVATCSCGHCCKGEFPQEARAYVSYGQNLRALIVYMSVHLSVPYNKIKSHLNSMYGIDISEGTIDNILKDAGDKSSMTRDEIRSLVGASSVVGMDETGENVNGENYWLWVSQTPQLTLYVLDKSRGRKVIQDTFSEDELAQMLLVTDRHSAYFTDNLKVSGHQVCVAHLLRNLTYTARAYPKDNVSEDIMQLLQEAIHYRKTQGTSADKKEEFDRELDKLLARPPVYVRSDKADTELDALKNGIAKCKEHIFNFLLWEDVPTTNNDSEKDLRYCKTKQKVSGGFRSDRGGQDYATLATVIKTALKNEANPVGTILAVIEGQTPDFLQGIKEKIEAEPAYQG